MIIYIRCRDCNFAQKMDAKGRAMNVAGSCPECKSGSIDANIGSVPSWWVEPTYCGMMKVVYGHGDYGRCGEDERSPGVRQQCKDCAALMVTP